MGIIIYYMLDILPIEMISCIFTFCDVKSIIAVSLVSQQFKNIMNKTNDLKCRCMLLGTIMKYYNDQIPDKLEQIVCGNVFGVWYEGDSVHNSLYYDDIKKFINPLSEWPSIKKITHGDIKNFINSINHGSEKEMSKIFDAFKEDMIDSLCDSSFVDSLIPFDTSYIQNNNRTQLMRVDDILQKAQKREKGDLFLYPNSIQLVGENGVNDSSGRRFGNYGTAGGILPSLPTWITSKKCDNWSRHHYERLGGYCAIDEYLPAELFLGIKEGDSITFQFKDKEIKVFCKQEKYRYPGLNFEERVLKLASGYGGVCSPSYYTPPLSEEEQKKKLKEFHDKYLASINN
jgi:hypothetical protein